MTIIFAHHQTKKELQATENPLQKKINKILQQYQILGVIFDLDGTLLDNNSYHRIAWEKYLENIGKKISPEEFNKHMNGRTNNDAVKYIFGEGTSDEEVTKCTLEKEKVYREIYQPFIKPVEGLPDFLEILKTKNIPMAIATSGIQPNIDFMFDNVPIRKYFKVVVNSSHIKNGKPDPEIYLKAASLLGILPKNCLVFEDAAVGVQSAKAAGMKVVALTTTQSVEQLAGADMIIENYKDF
jgi:beta-phosphoglucomutase family hydrolase